MEYKTGLRTTFGSAVFAASLPMVGSTGAVSVAWASPAYSAGEKNTTLLAG
jgi:hypothetical protein